MALFPEVQRKAQHELDAVLGEKQLPQFHDRDNLPYINALVKEVLRWHPVVPMSLAHTSIEDDMCEGYFIPKGSSILANIWYKSRIFLVSITGLIQHLGHSRMIQLSTMTP